MTEPHLVRRSRQRRSARVLAAAFAILLPALGSATEAEPGAAADVGFRAGHDPSTLSAISPPPATAERVAAHPDEPQATPHEPQATPHEPQATPDQTADPVSPVAAPDPPHSAPEHERPEILVKTILGLLALLALAYLAGHRRVQEWEARLGVSQVVTAGFPFVLLGIAARHPAIGIASEPVLAKMGPLLGVALGWIGLVAGFRFDARLLGGLPSGAARAVALATSIPFAFVVGLTGVALLSLDGGISRAALREAIFFRDALIVGTAGAMTANTSARLLRRTESARALARIIRIEELAGVAGLAFVAAYFRPHAEGSWQLPGTAWLLLTLGLGATAGILSYAMIQCTKQGRPEFVVLTLGAVSFAAGLAATLHLSPLVVTFIAGVLLANSPGAYHSPLRAALRRLERPVYLMFLFAIGALWDVADWRGWVLVPVFMATRLIGKRVGANLAARGTDGSIGLDEREALAVAPMAPLAIAIVVNAQLLYPGGSISLIASAVVGGAILTEVAVQLVTHGNLSTLERKARARAALDGEDRSREEIA